MILVLCMQNTGFRADESVGQVAGSRCFKRVDTAPLTRPG